MVVLVFLIILDYKYVDRFRFRYQLFIYLIIEFSWEQLIQSQRNVFCSVSFIVRQWRVESEEDSRADRFRIRILV